MTEDPSIHRPSQIQNPKPALSEGSPELHPEPDEGRSRRVEGSQIQNPDSPGRVWKYGDGVNTDVIFPGKYTYTITDPAEMARHALEDLDPTFAANVRPGDVIVAGKNWGNGSSREQAAICLKAAGVRAVVAVSFARIWYRNAINNGLLALTCPEAVAALNSGDRVEIDLQAGLIKSDTGTFSFPSFAPSVQAIITDGGLIPHLKNALRY